MVEEWKKIEEYPEYYVSNFGLVLSHKRYPRGRLLTLGLSTHGYPIVHLCKNNKATTISVHRLVLEAFVGKRPEGYDGCHGDGNPVNNRLDNLRWDSKSSNQMDRIKHGTYQFGEKNAISILKESDVRNIKMLINDGLRNVFIAKLWGIGVTIVSSIKRDITWKWVEAKPSRV